MKQPNWQPLAITNYWYALLVKTRRDPPLISFTTLYIIYICIYRTCDMWHMTRDTWGRKSIELWSIELHSLKLHSSSEHQCSSSEHHNSSIKHHCSSSEHHSSSSDHHNSSSEHHNSSSEHHHSSSEQQSNVCKCNATIKTSNLYRFSHCYSFKSFIYLHLWYQNSS